MPWLTEGQPQSQSRRNRVGDVLSPDLGVQRVYQELKQGNLRCACDGRSEEEKGTNEGTHEERTLFELAVVTAVRTAKRTASHISVVLLMEPSFAAVLGMTTTVACPSMSRSMNMRYASPSCSYERRDGDEQGGSEMKKRHGVQESYSAAPSCVSSASDTIAEGLSLSRCL